MGGVEAVSDNDPKAINVAGFEIIDKVSITRLNFRGDKSVSPNGKPQRQIRGNIAL